MEMKTYRTPKVAKIEKKNYWKCHTSLWL